MNIRGSVKHAEARRLVATRQAQVEGVQAALDAQDSQLAEERSRKTEQ